MLLRKKLRRHLADLRFDLCRIPFVAMTGGTNAGHSKEISYIISGYIPLNLPWRKPGYLAPRVNAFECVLSTDDRAAQPVASDLISNKSGTKTPGGARHGENRN